MSVFDSMRFQRTPQYTSLDVRRAVLAGRQAAASRLEIGKVLDQPGGADSRTVFQDSTRRDLTRRVSGLERSVRK